MTTTGTQNRQYNDTEVLTVAAHFLGTQTTKGDAPPRPLVFNWNDRAAVRNFATISDNWIRRGGRTELCSIHADG